MTSSHFKFQSLLRTLCIGAHPALGSEVHPGGRVLQLLLRPAARVALLGLLGGAGGAGPRPGGSEKKAACARPYQLYFNQIRLLSEFVRILFKFLQSSEVDIRSKIWAKFPEKFIDIGEKFGVIAIFKRYFQK